MPDNNRFFIVRDLSLRLRVNTNQVQILPNFFHKLVEVPFIFCGYGHIMRTLVNDIEFLNRNLIDLVKHIDAWDIDPVSLDYIDELIDSRVASKCKVGVRDLILGGDGFDCLIRHVCHLKVH